MAPKTKVMTDDYLDAGFVGVLVKHPLTGKEQETLLDLSTYPQNRPGIVKFGKDVLAGKIAPVHGAKSLFNLAMFAFAKVAKDKGDKFVSDALASVDDSIKTAQKEQELTKWRDAIAKLDNGKAQKVAIDLYTEQESIKAQLADVQERIATTKSEIATQLGIDKTFDLALVDTGWYVASDTKKSKPGVTIERNYSADTYEVTRTMRGVKVLSVATIKERDKTGAPTNWHVSYTVLDGKHKGESFEHTSPSLNGADNGKGKDGKPHGARRQLMIALDLPGVKRNNAPVWYKIPTK